MLKDTSKMSEQELREYVQQLEAIAQKNKTTRSPEMRITEEDGLFQIRHLTSQSVNLQPSVVRWLIDNASTVLAFIRTNASLLSDTSDTPEISEQKLQARRQNLSAENPVVRPKKDISWRQSS